MSTTTFKRAVAGAAVGVGWTGGSGGRLLLDPTGELHPSERTRLPRPESLAGLTVALLDISKPRGDVFLDRMTERLTERGLTVERFRKPTFTKVAPIDLRQQIATQCHVVIEALAD